jgi:hypothetical protein
MNSIRPDLFSSAVAGEAGVHFLYACVVKLTNYLLVLQVYAFVRCLKLPSSMALPSFSYMKSILSVADRIQTYSVTLILFFFIMFVSRTRNMPECP